MQSFVSPNSEIHQKNKVNLMRPNFHLFKVPFFPTAIAEQNL